MRSSPALSATVSPSLVEELDEGASRAGRLWQSTSAAGSRSAAAAGRPSRSRRAPQRAARPAPGLRKIVHGAAGGGASARRLAGGPDLRVAYLVPEHRLSEELTERHVAATVGLAVPSRVSAGERDRADRWRVSRLAVFSNRNDCVILGGPRFRLRPKSGSRPEAFWAVRFPQPK